jgi:hypothetical protein
MIRGLHASSRNMTSTALFNHCHFLGYFVRNSNINNGSLALSLDKRLGCSTLGSMGHHAISHGKKISTGKGVILFLERGISVETWK